MNTEVVVFSTRESDAEGAPHVNKRTTTPRELGCLAVARSELKGSSSGFRKITAKVLIVVVLLSERQMFGII